MYAFLKTFCASAFVGACVVAGGAWADTGLMGGWAADPADCAYVSDRDGVVRDIIAGIITPDNIYFHGGECYYTGVFPNPQGATFVGICDEGDGPYEERLEAVQTGPDTMRATWSEGGWTTYHRCWDLPTDWQERTR